jgi:hypothetical protein
LMDYQMIIKLYENLNDHQSKGRRIHL